MPKVYLIIDFDCTQAIIYATNISSNPPSTAYQTKMNQKQPIEIRSKAFI